MTDEEKQAIERLKGTDIKNFLSGMTEQSNYIVDEADKTNIAIETVLNLIEKKDKIIKAMVDIDPYIYRLATIKLKENKEEI